MKNVTIKMLFFAAIIAGCGEGDIEFELPPPKSQFDAPLKNHKIDLASVFGGDICVVKGQDTITYQIAFDDHTKTNLILKEMQDTIFAGTVNKLGGTYLFNRSLANGNYRIFALEITDSTVSDLGSEYEQGYFMDHLVETGELGENVVDSIEYYLLLLKKRDAKRLFWRITDSLETYTWFPSDLLNNVKREKEWIEDSSSKITQDSTAQVEAFPNPFTDVLNIASPSSLIDEPFEIRGSDGETKIRGELHEGVNQIPTTELEPGIYFVLLPKSGLKCKIIKK